MRLPTGFPLTREISGLAVRRWRKLCAPLHPDPPRGQPVFVMVAVDGAVAHPIVGLVRGVRDGGVDLAHPQGLIGVGSGGTGWASRHARHCTIFYPIWLCLFLGKAKFLSKS